MKLFLILLCVLQSVPSYALITGFSRYEVILTRRPFGEPPAEVQLVAPAPVMTGPSFADSLKMVALTASRGDIRVGFVDTKEKQPKTYFLFVGESQDGIEVVSASYEDEVVVLRKGADERTLSMANGGCALPAGMVPAKKAAAVGGVPAVTQTIRPVVPSPGRVATPRVLSSGRQLRLEEERRRAEALPELHGQVLEKHLQEYNMEAIRNGSPPLPVALTEEQDAQLVAEGVLPPVE